MHPGPVTITDPQDVRLDDYRELKDATRRRSGTFIAESERVITRLLQSPFTARSVLLTANRYARLQHCLPDGIEAFVADESTINHVVGFPLHRGAVALGVRPTTMAPPLDLLGSARVAVVIEDVVDPDNIGAIFRHSAAFGVGGVILSPSAGDPLYRKALRAAVGWSLHVPWTRMSADQWPSTLVDLRSDGWHALALTPSDDASVLPKTLAELGPDSRIALLVGTEHDGLTPAALEYADVLARIPMAAGVDSLNVATTVAIALYELTKREWR